MPHEVTIREDGTAELAYTGARPWHQLGTYVDHLMTAEEAIVAGGLDWTVTKESLYTRTKRNTGLHATVREDTGEYFAAVGDYYEPLQNKDAFGFMDGVVGEQLAAYEVVGSLRGGRMVWLLMKLPESVAIADRDVVDEYLLLSNSHDGSSAVDIRWTPVRVVCNNTLTIALGQGGTTRFRTAHTTNIESRMKDGQKALGLAKDYFAAFAVEAEQMARTPLTPAQFGSVLGQLFQVDQARAIELVKDGGATRQSERGLVEVARLNEEGMGNEEFAWTAWGLYNGLTQWLDHERPVRLPMTKRENAITDEQIELIKGQRRMEDSWFPNLSGVAVPMRQKAWNLLTA